MNDCLGAVLATRTHMVCRCLEVEDTNHYVRTAASILSALLVTQKTDNRRSTNIKQLTECPNTVGPTHKTSVVSWLY